MAIDANKVFDLIKDGKIFTVTFLKRTSTETSDAGSVRVMTARLGVKKHLKGGTLKYDPKSKGLIGCWEVPQNAPESAPADKKGGYKMINVQSILKLKAGGKEYSMMDLSEEAGGQ